jgi:hypothetical protein
MSSYSTSKASHVGVDRRVATAIWFWTMQADLLAVVGAILLVVGGPVAVGRGVHRKWSTGNAGTPVLGDVVAVLGAPVICSARSWPERMW